MPLHCERWWALTIFEFGDAKLRANDLDPLYTALYRTKLPHAVLCAYTIAEVMFDHAGLAARIAESKDFWQACTAAAQQPLRGAPRRYFRGPLALQAIEVLRHRYLTPVKAVEALWGPFAYVNKYICANWPQFGPCAAFKLADMVERVCLQPIDFSACTAAEVCNSRQVQQGFDKACQVLGIAPAALLPTMQRYKWATLASPRYDRPLNAQEFETLLCYYSHNPARSKHLPGMDIVGISSELEGYGRLARKLQSNLPK